jgi:phosphoglycerol transferase MdoB-like AlkP superfamily enzyme
MSPLGAPARSLSWLGSKTRLIATSRSFVFLVFIVALSEVLYRITGVAAVRSHLRTELPLLLGIYWAFTFVFRPTKLSAFVAAIPIVVFYLGFDLFHLFWGSIFKAIDSESLPLLLKVLPWPSKIGVVLLLFSPIVLVLCFVDYRKYLRVISVAVLAALVVLAVELRPSIVLAALEKAGFQVAEWSDVESVNENGRLATTLYFEAKRRQAFFDTATYAHRTDYENEIRANVDLIRTYGNHRNVHLVVLESFVDPNLFAGVSYSKDPRSPEFAELVGDNQSFSVSPVFGGESAQAEFEVLCGVPALQKLSEIEFDDFTGDATGCMPDILGQSGYSTIVSNAFEPDYFNWMKAYPGVGFQKIDFPREYGSAQTTYLTAKNVSDSEQYVFDGDLFDQNLAFIKQTLRDAPNRPILNYVVGTYGHEPHEIDTGKRPLVISMTAAHKDEQLLRAVNQYWYRSQAIARYIRALIALDPKSLIIVVSDHLPPLDAGIRSYSDFRYLNNTEDSTHLNRILIVEDGRVVRRETIHHYQIPTLIYGYLTGNAFCARSKCDPPDSERETQYMSLMAHAVGHH